MLLGLSNIVTYEEMSEIVVYTKPCPKCRMPIEKDGGCVHMHCSKCQTPFCWKCGQIYLPTDGYYHNCATGGMASTVSIPVEFRSLVDNIKFNIGKLIIIKYISRGWSLVVHVNM